jgi:hypothetical protein
MLLINIGKIRYKWRLLALSRGFHFLYTVYIAVGIFLSPVK